MTEGEVVALISGAFATVAAVIAAWQAVLARRENRVGAIEARLFGLERENRLMWLWCRQLVDHIYRGNPPPPPPAPTGLFDTDEKEGNR